MNVLIHQYLNGSTVKAPSHSHPRCLKGLQTLLSMRDLLSPLPSYLSVLKHSSLCLPRFMPPAETRTLQSLTLACDLRQSHLTLSLTHRHLRCDCLRQHLTRTRSLQVRLPQVNHRLSHLRPDQTARHLIISYPQRLHHRQHLRHCLHQPPFLLLPLRIHLKLGHLVEFVESQIDTAFLPRPVRTRTALLTQKQCPVRTRKLGNKRCRENLTRSCSMESVRWWILPLELMSSGGCGSSTEKGMSITVL